MNDLSNAIEPRRDIISILGNVLRLLVPGVLVTSSMSMVIHLTEVAWVAFVVTLGPLLYALTRANARSEHVAFYWKPFLWGYDNHVAEVANAFRARVSIPDGCSNMEVLYRHQEKWEEDNRALLDRAKNEFHYYWCLSTCSAACAFGVMVLVGHWVRASYAYNTWSLDHMPLLTIAVYFAGYLVMTISAKRFLAPLKSFDLMQIEEMDVPASD